LSDERPPASGDLAELQRLLHRLNQSTSSPQTSLVEEAAREQRMAARIDGQLAELVRERRVSWRARFGMLAAAAVLLSLVGWRYLKWNDPASTIEQEPLIAKQSDAAPRPSAEPPAAVGEPAVLQARVAAPVARSAAASAIQTLPPAPSVTPAEPSSALAHENRLFKEAAHAARTGDVEGALSGLERLLSENPSSPLAQSALVRKFRLLSSGGRSKEARREAERYLATYPTGFAVEEAEAIRNAAAGSGEAMPAGGAGQ
jgi:hypothetical protein